MSKLLINSTHTLKNLFILNLFFISQIVFADNADVVDVEIKAHAESRYSFSVAVNHNDTGWDHYVDRWELLTMDNKILAVRALRHPHVNEQPFTRTLPYIIIPAEIGQLRIRAHCSRDGYTGNVITVQIPD